MNLNVEQIFHLMKPNVEMIILKLQVFEKYKVCPIKIVTDFFLLIRRGGLYGRDRWGGVSRKLRKRAQLPPSLSNVYVEFKLKV